MGGFSNIVEGLLKYSKFDYIKYQLYYVTIYRLHALFMIVKPILLPTQKINKKKKCPFFVKLMHSYI